jgi:hypothetical protein
VASDCNGHRISLTEIFGEETELVNIAKEVTRGTIAQRIKEWCARSKRHVYIGRGANIVEIKIQNSTSKPIMIFIQETDSSIAVTAQSTTKYVDGVVMVPTEIVGRVTNFTTIPKLCLPTSSVRCFVKRGSLVGLLTASPSTVDVDRFGIAASNMNFDSACRAGCRPGCLIYIGEAMFPPGSFGTNNNTSMTQQSVITINTKSSSSQRFSTAECLTEFVNFWSRFTSHNIHIYNSAEVEVNVNDLGVWEYVPFVSLFRWGNPFSHLEQSAAEWKVDTREEAIAQYRAYILSRPDLLEKLHELKGKRLGCWCVPQSCHGMILLELLWHVKVVDEEG